MISMANGVEISKTRLMVNVLSAKLRSNIGTYSGDRYYCIYFVDTCGLCICSEDTVAKRREFWHSLDILGRRWWNICVG